MISRGSVRAGAGAFALVAVLGCVALALLASHARRSTAFSLDLHASGVITTIDPQQTGCQGPFNALNGFKGVEVWLGGEPGPVDTQLVVRRAGRQGPVLAHGHLHFDTYAAATYVVPLSGSIPAGTEVSVCLRDTGTNAISPLGSPGNASTGYFFVGNKPVIVSGGVHMGAQMLMHDAPHSLLSQTSTIFSRASLFKTTWLGPWTFWMLAGLLAAGFVGLGFAVAAAARDDDDDAETPQRGR